MIFATDHDLIFIEGLTIDTVIGLYDWERTITQSVIIDLVLYSDTKRVANSHDLTQGIDYKKVSDDVTRWTQDMQAELVEELAEHLADQLFANYAVDKVTLKISKPTAIEQARGVGVQITRHRQ